jgi:hypothetical protein
MRSTQNLERSTNTRVGGKLRLSELPLEWLDAGSWRLPSGKALAEFALQAGFLAPLLFKTERSAKAAVEGSPALDGRAAQARSKHFGKGGSR